MMQRLQTLFNRLAGVASFEADRLALAHAIYGERDCRYAALETPAYLSPGPRLAGSLKPEGRAVSDEFSPIESGRRSRRAPCAAYCLHMNAS